MHGQNLMHTDWSTKTTEQQQQHTSTAMTKKRWQRKNWNLMIVKHLLIIKQWRCGCILLIQFREPCAFFALRTVYKREKLIIIDTNVSALNKVVYFRILCMPQCRCCLLIYIYIYFLPLSSGRMYWVGVSVFSLSTHFIYLCCNDLSILRGFLIWRFFDSCLEIFSVYDFYPFGHTIKNYPFCFEFAPSLGYIFVVITQFSTVTYWSISIYAAIYSCSMTEFICLWIHIMHFECL